MCDNIIVCRNLVVSPACTIFKGNKLSQCVNLRIEDTFENNTIDAIFYKSNLEIVYYTDEEFKELSKFTEFTEFEEIAFNGKIKNLKATKISNCKFYKDIISCVLGTIANTEFEETIEDSSINEIIRPDVNYFYKLPKLTNTSILEISNDVVFLGEIKNTTIDKLTNKVVVNNISDCCIGEIKDNTIINGDLVNIIIKEIVNSTIDGSIQNSILDSIKDTVILGTINNSTIKNVTGIETFTGTILDSTINNISNSVITGTIIKGSCGNVEESYITAELYNVSFKNLTNCTFSGNTITDVTSFYDLFSFDSSDYDLLYVSEKVKEIYLVKGEPKVLFIPDVVFQRGMIIMHSGIVDIPEGWAICDGNEYTFNGVTSITPDLRNRFIKAVDNKLLIGKTDNTILNEKGEFTLTTEYLPEHTHPHNEHTHSISDVSISINNSGSLSVSGAINSFDSTLTAVQSVSGPEGVTITTTKGNSGEVYSYENTEFTGGNHTHTAEISDGITSSVVSKEKVWQYGETKPLQFIPNYYSLIFIMKL